MAFSLRISAALAGVWLASSCGGPNTADALIGPEGGVVSHDDGVTLTVPAGALLTTRQIVIRPSSEKLSSGTYEQVGDAYLFEPRDLEFKIPAELSFDSKDTPDKPIVLIRPGERRVIAYSGADDRAVAYIGTLGVAAMGKAGDPIATVDAPVLARTPAELDLGSAAVNLAELKVTPSGTTVLDLGFTAFAPGGMSAAELNGEGTQYCGFKVGMVLGASITGGCSSGLTSATIGLSSPQAVAQVVPFLIGKVDQPVMVEVQVGNGDLAISLGYFAFKTSACYLESCSGHGVCDDAGGPAKCSCDEGYAANAKACDCVPKCDGKQCGNDACGGQCGPGCDAAVSTCNYDSGQCDPLPPPESTGPDTTMPPDPSTTTTGDDTTGNPDPSTTTTGDPSTTTGDPSTTTGTTGTTG